MGAQRRGGDCTRRENGVGRSREGYQVALRCADRSSAEAVRKIGSPCAGIKDKPLEAIQAEQAVVVSELLAEQQASG